MAVIAGTPDGVDESAGTVRSRVTPTPSPLPRTRLDRAQQLYWQGDYAAARSELAILRTTLSLGDRFYVESQLLLARSYIEESLYQEALIILEPLVTAKVGDEDATSSVRSNDFDFDLVAAQTQLLYAETLNQLGRYAEALAQYTQFVEEHSWAEETVKVTLGNIRLNLGESEEAIDAYAQAVAAAGDAATKANLLEAIARIETGRGNYDRAVAAYDEILAFAKRPAYRTSIQLRKGNAAAVGGDDKEAISAWLAALEEDPTNEDAHASLVELVNRNVEVDLYLRGSVNLASKVWLPAINAFQGYLDSVPENDERVGLAMLGLAQAYLGLGNYSDALTVADNLLQSYPDCECAGQAWLEKALAQAWLGDGVGSHKTYRTFAREFPDDPLAPEALWRSAQLALLENSPVEATVDLLALVDGFPLHQRAPDALFLLATSAWEEGMWGQSATLFERILRDYPQYKRAEVAYWLGRANYARSRADGASDKTRSSEQATEAWEIASEATPGEYYSVLATIALAQKEPRFDNLLSDMKLVDSPPSTLQGDDGSQQFAEAWLRSWVVQFSTGSRELNNDTAGVSQDVAQVGSDKAAGSQNLISDQLPSHIITDTNWVQGAFLLELNFRLEALPVLERLIDDNLRDPGTLYALSLAFERIGAYRLSIMAANQLLLLSPAKHVENAPVFIQKLLYPKRFSELIEREAIQHEIDPLLYYSLIRQESLFEPGSRSVAAAQGLAQVIPDTGAWIADQVGFVNYRNELVYRPHINLWFGAYYFDWAREYLDGNQISALVGYNAGPGYSAQERKTWGNDDVLFVLNLDYGEPRLYVEKITSNYYHYSRLYG